MLHRPTGPEGRLIVALDTPDIARAEALTERLPLAINMISAAFAVQ